jgi:hypothetical protein
MTSILPGSATPDHVAAITLIASEGRDILGEPIEGLPNLEAAANPDDDIYYSSEEGAKDNGLDWTGPNRERRASYLLLRLLENEGIL